MFTNSPEQVTDMPAHAIAAALAAAPVHMVEVPDSIRVSAALWRLKSTERFPVPPLSAHLVCISLSGARHLGLWVDDRDLVGGPSVPGSVKLVPALTASEVAFDGLPNRDGRMESLHLYIGTDAFGAAGLPEPTWISPSGLNEPDHWMEMIARRLACVEADRPCTMEVGHLVVVALAHLTRSIGRTSLPEAPRGGLAAWQVKRVRDYVEADLTGVLTVGKLAELCRLSPFHFARAFHQSVGEPPHAYVTTRRLARARRLLEETDMSVTEIALDVGYAEPSHLARLFKRVHGVGPIAFRRART